MLIQGLLLAKIEKKPARSRKQPTSSHFPPLRGPPPLPPPPLAAVSLVISSLSVARGDEEDCCVSMFLG
jgi:hypothetical protein